MSARREIKSCWNIYVVYGKYCGYLFYMYFGFIVVSAMECTGIAPFTFTMWKIRSCLLSKLIHQKSLSFIYLQFCGYFLWVQSIEVNSVAVSSKQVQRFEGKWFGLDKKDVPQLLDGLCQCRGKSHDCSKISCGRAKPWNVDVTIC